MSIDGVEDPVETQNGIDDNGAVVPPGVFEAERRSEKAMLGRRIEQACDD